MPVAAPLPDIAVHVMQAPRVRQLLADRVGLLAAVAAGLAPIAVPADTVEVGRGLAVPERADRARPAGVLPLGLGR